MVIYRKYNVYARLVILRLKLSCRGAGKITRDILYTYFMVLLIIAMRYAAQAVSKEFVQLSPLVWLIVPGQLLIQRRVLQYSCRGL